MVVLVAWCGCSVLFPFAPGPATQCEGCPGACDEQACSFVCHGIREDGKSLVLDCLAGGGRCGALEVLSCMDDSAATLTPTELAENVVAECLNTDGAPFRVCADCNALGALSDEALEAHRAEDCLRADSCSDYLACITGAFR